MAASKLQKRADRPFSKCCATSARLLWISSRSKTRCAKKYYSPSARVDALRRRSILRTAGFFRFFEVVTLAADPFTYDGPDLLSGSGYARNDFARLENHHLGAERTLHARIVIGKTVSFQFPVSSSKLVTRVATVCTSWRKFRQTLNCQLETGNEKVTRFL